MTDSTRSPLLPPQPSLAHRALRRLRELPATLAARLPIALWTEVFLWQVKRGIARRRGQPLQFKSPPPGYRYPTKEEWDERVRQDERRRREGGMFVSYSRWVRIDDAEARKDNSDGR
ncbi:hypothetical protein [Roseicella aerolata]|uniref:Uncharacterized protein n=1 Tax=Roseicella aerolata TaxID=2883479 RepID=A0A9X1L748_9PROT|nr:hypothetical protein [Roseicella aerolata]MCB4821169.1 hypothetical protein [Roseicella aerolata]